MNRIALVLLIIAAALVVGFLLGYLVASFPEILSQLRHEIPTPTPAPFPVEIL